MSLANPFVRKSVAEEDYLESQLRMETIRRDSMIFNPGSLLSNFMLFNNNPQWQTLSGMQSLFDWYHINPVLYSTVMIKAREYANMKIKVVNRRSGAIENEWSQKPIPRKLYRFFNKPNPLQSRWEFFKQGKILHEVGGNSLKYGNFTMGMSNHIDNLSALWNVWPAYMKYKLTGKYFEATKVEDIIQEWKFEAGHYRKTWKPNEVLHRNEPNTEVKDGVIFGRSHIQALVKPLSNIDMAYESRNVLMKNRGFRAVISSDREDASGRIALGDEERESVQDNIKGYGIREGQQQFFFSHVPLSVTTIDQDVAKLGLFEEISTDAMIVCNAYGVPEVLLKLYIKGATFENQESSVRRLYQGTLIPEAVDEMLSLNSFLGLDDEEWMMMGTFDHVAALQESEEKKEATRKAKSDRLLGELAQNLITPEEYREQMGYPKMAA